MHATGEKTLVEKVPGIPGANTSVQRDPDGRSSGLLDTSYAAVGDSFHFAGRVITFTEAGISVERKSTAQTRDFSVAQLGSCKMVELECDNGKTLLLVAIGME